MIIPRITTPAIFHTYGSIRSDASGWKPGSDAAVGEEDIRYLNVRYQTFLLQPPTGGGGSPPVMREGLVGLRHAVNVVLALVSAALLGLRVHELVGEALRHGLLAPLAGELDEPAHR